MPDLKGIDLTEPGFITISPDSGPTIKYPLADILRAVDIPVGLTHIQVDGIRLLSNLVVVLIRTLVEKDILDETFADSLGMNWDLNHLIYAIEQMGGAYHSPDLDDVEDA